MTQFNVNINSDAVEKQYNDVLRDSQPKNQNSTFDAKNYLQARLEEGENEKTLTIRLLPFSPEGGSPFKKVWIHTIRVNREVSKSGWKMIPCPEKNAKDGKKCECPICKVSRHAQEQQREATDEVTKKKLGEVAFMDKAKEAWVVRCIDRDHEEDGVKFWLFNSSNKQQGIYDHMMNFYKLRNESGKKKGNDYNIFDLNNGEDFIITITRGKDNKTSYKVADEGFPSPLTTDFEKGLSWIKDEKKWTEVFPTKSPEYMRILVEGGVPVYDKEKQMYVDKNAKVQEDEERNQNELENNLTPDTSSKFEANPETANTGNAVETPSTQVPNEIFSNDNDDDVDLPF